MPHCKEIAFIFAHRKTDVWSTPLSIVNEFESRGWKTSIYSLFDENDNYTDKNIQKLLDTCNSEIGAPDIIFHMDWGRHLSPILSKLKLTGAYCIMEAGDDPQNQDRNLIKAPYFDLILTPDYESNEFYKSKGFNSVWWTHFADTKIHYPQDAETRYVAVTSRGKGGSQFLDKITDHGQGLIGNKNGFQGIEHSKFLCEGLLVIQNSRWGEITRRIFEGMACGKMVLTDRLNQNKHLEDLFQDEWEIVYYDDMIDCLSKINFYHINKDIREDIAKRGKEKVLNNHTQKHRVDKILELCLDGTS